VYNAAISLILKLNSLVKPLIFALFPILSNSYTHNRALYHSYLKKSSKYVYTYLCYFLYGSGKNNGLLVWNKIY
jgi:hypothetical protein